MDTDTLQIPFGVWLLSQGKRDDWVADLAVAAKADRTFPKQGDPEAIRKHMSSQGAEGHMFEMLEDAEREWLRG